MPADASNVNLMQATIPMILFFAVLLALYFLVISMKKSGLVNFRGRYVKFIERVPLGWDRTILIFEVQGCYYIVSMDKSGMRVIDKRSDITEDELNNPETFKNIFAKLSGNKNSEFEDMNERK